MKIKFDIFYKDRNYQYLSDNSKDCEDKNTLFVQTTRNADFVPKVKSKGLEILHFTDLKKYFRFPPKIIGITGTNGKTTIANLIYFILLDRGYSCAMLGTQGLFFNHKQLKPKGLTTPTILELYENMDLLAGLGCEFLVMEVSSHAIEQQRIYGVDFSSKVISNITSDHLDYHKTIEAYRAIKNDFLKDEIQKIINLDDKNINFNPINAFSYSIDSSLADLYVKKYDISGAIKAELVFDTKSYVLDSNLYGLHNLYNMLAALLCVKNNTSATMEDILQSIRKFEGVSGRMEVISKNPLVIVDFAHTHDGMEKIFESFSDKKIIVLFGAGGNRDRTKRPLMGRVADLYAQKIYLTSDNPRSENPQDIIQDILEGIEHKDKVVIEPDRKQAMRQALRDLQGDGGVLLVLGKGDEREQILGDRVIVFDDREVLRQLLKEC